MDPLFHLEDMLSDFKSLFKHNNFNHFHTFKNIFLRVTIRDNTQRKIGRYLKTLPETDRIYIFFTIISNNL